MPKCFATPLVSILQPRLEEVKTRSEAGQNQNGHQQVEGDEPVQEQPRHGGCCQGGRRGRGWWRREGNEDKRRFGEQGMSIFSIFFTNTLDKLQHVCRTSSWRLSASSCHEERSPSSICCPLSSQFDSNWTELARNRYFLKIVHVSILFCAYLWMSVGPPASDSDGSWWRAELPTPNNHGIGFGRLQIPPPHDSRGNHRCSLRGARDWSCIRLHPQAPSSDVRRRGEGCHDNTSADCWEDGGSGRKTYITIIIFVGTRGAFFFWNGMVEERRVKPFRCLLLFSALPLTS